MFTIGNKELLEKEPLGDFILCGKCGERHIIKYGKEILSDGTKVETKSLSFYNCNGKTYLAGIDCKDVRKENK